VRSAAAINTLPLSNLGNNTSIEIVGHPVDPGHRPGVAYRVRGGIGGSRPLYLPDHESRFIRLRVLKRTGGTNGVAIREISIEPPSARPLASMIVRATKAAA